MTRTIFGRLPAPFWGVAAEATAAAAGTALNHSRRVCFSDATHASGGSLSSGGGGRPGTEPGFNQSHARLAEFSEIGIRCHHRPVVGNRGAGRGPVVALAGVSKEDGAGQREAAD